MDSLMRRITGVTVVSAFAMLMACGGSGGGGGGSGGGGAAVTPTGMFTKSVTPPPTASNTTPFASGIDVKVQSLYLASDVNGAGNITKLRFQRGQDMAADVTCPNTTIKLGHTSVTALSATFASNVETGQGSLTPVFDNATVSIPAGAAGAWFDIPLSTPFQYNGQDNLVVEITRVTGCSAVMSLNLTNAASTRYAQSLMTDTNPGTSDLGSAESTATAGMSSYQVLMQVVFAGGDDLAWYGNASTNSYPFFNGFTNRMQMLHPAATINGSGPITGIGMVVGSTTSGGAYTVSIKLGHSTLTDLTTDFASNFSGNPVTVADHLTFTVPAGVPAGSTLWLPVNGIFTYNGTDNLIVDIDVSTTTGGTTSWMTDPTVMSNSVRVLGASGSTSGTSPDNTAYNTQFRFNGGPLLVLPLTAAVGSSQVLGDGLAGQLQSLYQNSMLGTSGTIQNVYVRLAPGSVPTAATLTNYKMYMGHTTKNTYLIGDTYNSNMNENALVMSGMLTVPAGLKAGDWVKIPLTTPFAYDSTKNLSILFTTDISTMNGNLVRAPKDATLFASNSVGRNDNSVTSSGAPSWTFDGVVELKMDLVK